MRRLLKKGNSDWDRAKATCPAPLPQWKPSKMFACLWGWSSPVIYNCLQAVLIYVGASAQLVQTSKAAWSNAAGGVATGRAQTSTWPCHFPHPDPLVAVLHKEGWWAADSSNRLPKVHPTSSRYLATSALHHLSVMHRCRVQKCSPQRYPTRVWWWQTSSHHCPPKAPLKLGTKGSIS